MINHMYFSGYLRLTSWDFASMLGLGTQCEAAVTLPLSWLSNVRSNYHAIMNG